MGDVRGGGGHRRDVPELKQADINLSGVSGTQLIVAGVSGFCIGIVSMHLRTKDVVLTLFLDGATTIQRTILPKDSVHLFPPGGEQQYWMFTSTGAGFSIDLDITTDVVGGLTYREVIPENL